MSKKGSEAIENVIKAIIAIFLILVMIWIMPAQIKEPFKKLLGLGGNLTKTSDELAVTQAEFKTTELQTVANSVNALTCAINSIATGQYPYSGCAEAFDIVSKSLITETVNEQDYAQKLGDRILRCYKDYKPNWDSVVSRSCYTTNPESGELNIDEGKIQDYLKTLEKDEQAKDLAGVGLFNAKDYKILLSGNTLKKDSIICGYGKKVILTDNKENCGLPKEVECEGDNIRKYGNTCLKCSSSLVCCEYCPTTACNPEDKLKVWESTEEKCLRQTGGKVVQAQNGICGAAPSQIKFEGEALQPITQTQMRCTITNFNLPQQDVSEAKKWIGNFGDPEYIMYHERFPDGEEKSWQFEKDRLFIAAIGVQSLFTMIPLVGKLGGEIASPVFKQFSKSSKIVKAYSEAAEAGTVDIKTMNKLGKGMDSIAKKNPEEAVRVLADLERITLKNGPLGIAIKEFDDTASKKVMYEIENLITEPGQEVFVSKGGVYVLSDAHKTILKQRLAKVEYFEGQTIGSNPTLQKAIDDIIDKRGFTTPDIALNKISKEISDNAESAIDDAVIAATKRSGGLSNIGLMMQRAGYQKTFRAIMKQNGDDLGKVLEGSVNKMKDLKAANPAAFEKALDDADDIASTMIDPKTGVINWEKMLADGTEDDLIKVVDSMSPEKLKSMGVQINSFSELLSGRTVGKGFFAGTLSTVGLDEGFKVFIKKQAKGFGCAAIPAAGIMAVSGVGTAAGVSALAVTGGACAAWLRTNQLPIILMVSYLIAEYDSQNEKYMPVGNNIAVTKPKILKAEFEAAKFDTSPTKYSYISMYRDTNDGQKPQKLFFASPCATDLKIKQEFCSGKIYSGDYVLNYSVGNKIYSQPVKGMSTANIKNMQHVYYWDGLTNDEKIKALKSLDANQDIGIIETIAGYMSDQTTKTRAIELIETDHTLMKDLILDYFAPDMTKFVHLLHNHGGKNTFFSIEAADTSDSAQRTSSINFLCQIGLPIPDEQNTKEAMKDQPACQNYNFKQVSSEDYKKFIEYLVDFYYEGEISKEDLQFNFKFSDGTEINLWGLKAQIMHVNLQLFIKVFMLNAEYSLPIGSQVINSYEKFLKGEASTPPYSGPQYHQQELGAAYWKYFANQYRGEKNFLEYIGKRATYNYAVFSESDVVDKNQIVKAFTGEYSYQDQESGAANQLAPTRDNGKVIRTTTSVPCLTVEPDQSPYGYNNNFCYSGKNQALQYTEYAFDAAGIAGGIFLSGITGGLAVPLTIAAADVGSIATSIIIKYCGNWPNHKAGLAECFS